MAFPFINRSKRTFAFYLAATLFFCKAICSPAYSQQVLTLNDCIQLALKKNITVASADNNRDLAKITFEQSRMQRLPQASINISQGINTGRSIDPFTNLYNEKTTGIGNYGISLEVPIFSGMQLSNTIKRNEALLNSLGNDAETARNTLVLQMVAAYISVISSGEIEKAILVQLNNSKTQLEAAKIKVKAGVLGEAQLADFEILVASEELEKENAHYAFEQSRLQLFLLLNIPPDEKISFAPLETTGELPDAISLDAATVYSEALKHLPDIKSVAAKRKSIQYDVLVAKGSRFPTLSFYSGLNSNYSSSAPPNRFEPDGTTRTVLSTSANSFVTVGGTDYYIQETQQVQNGTFKPFGFINQIPFNRSFNVGLTLRIPIINGMQARFRVNTAKANLDLITKQEDFVQTQLLNTITQAILNYKNAQNRITILTKQEKAYEQSVQNASLKLNAGTGSQFDYTLVKTNYDKTMISLIQAKYEQAFRWRIINFYNTGKWD